MDKNSKMFKYHIEDSISFDDDDDDEYDEELEYIKSLNPDERKEYSMKSLQQMCGGEIRDMDFEDFKRNFNNDRMLVTNPKVMAIMYGVSKLIKEYCKQPKINIIQNANSEVFENDFPTIITSGYVEISCTGFELSNRTKVKEFAYLLKLCNNFWETTIHTDGTIKLNFDFKNANILVGGINA